MTVVEGEDAWILYDPVGLENGITASGDEAQLSMLTPHISRVKSLGTIFECYRRG